MLRRKEKWRGRVARLLAVATAAATLSAISTGVVAYAQDCFEHVYAFQTNSTGTYVGPLIDSNNPGYFGLNTRNPFLRYLALAGVTQPRRSATFKFTNDQGQYIGPLFTTRPSDDGGVIRQEENVIPFTFSRPGERVHVYADYRKRCGVADIHMDNVYIGDIMTFPSSPATIDPKYLVVGVAYGPPGSASFVEYGNSTTLGAKVSMERSFEAGVSQSTTLVTGDEPNTLEAISTENGFKQKTQDGRSVTVEKSASNALVVPGPASSLSGIDHRFDRFYLWLNPRYTVTVTSDNTVETSPFTVDPTGPVGTNMDVVEVTVAQLQSGQFPAGVGARLQRTWSATGALTRADFDRILQENPLANGGAPDPARFDLLPGQVFDYSPATPGGQPTTRRLTVGFKEAATQSISSTLSISSKTTFAEDPDITIPLLNGKLKNKTTESFDFTSSTSLEFSQAVGETTTLSLTGPTEDYQGCTAIQVYQDNFYGSLAFACAPIPTFGFTLPSPSQTVVQGSNATYPISTQSMFGYNNAVTFDSVSGLPAGATASFSPNPVTPVNGSTTLTVATSASTPPGTYSLMVNASSGLISRRLPATLIVQPKPFTIAVSPSTQTILSAGQPAVYTVTVTPAGGFSGPVSLLGPGGLPPGASASYSPSTLPNGSGTSTLTVTTSASTPSGTSTLNIRGSGGNITQSVPATLVVDNSGDFGLTVTPQASGITAGETAVYTVTTNAINNFNGTINLSLAGQPLGTTPTFTPGSITGAGTSTLRIPTSASTQPADYDITVTGTGGGKTHSQIVSLTVSAPPPDTTPPTVMSTAPTSGATGVPVTSPVTVQFSESMSPATVTGGGNVEVHAGGSLIGSTVAYDAVNQRAVVTPAAQMAAGTGYTVTVKGGAIGVSDQAGNRMAANKVFSFTTDAPAGGDILGYNHIGAQVDTGDKDFMNGSRFVTGAGGLAPAQAFAYVTSVQAAPANQFQMAIYTDSGGRPATLVASTASGTLTPNSWNSRPISATLAPNTPYWLMYNTSGDNNLSFDSAPQGTGGWSLVGQPYGTWRPTFGTSVISTLKFSLYVQ